MRFVFAIGSTITIIVALLTVSTAGQDAAAAEEEHLDDTTLQPVSEEPIKFVHVLNPGEREYLSPNLIGVQNIAMTFLPLSMNFINIVDAYREIVDGVQYEIHLNAFDSKAPNVDFVCRLVIIEKPWLRTEWGDKVRELRHSNCTGDADNLPDPAERGKALNDKYPKNAFFNGGSRNELGTDEMAKIESQILPLSNSLKRSATTSTTTTTTSTTTTTTETPTAATEKSEIEAATHATDKRESSLSAENDDEELKPLPVLNENEMKWLDDFLSVGALSFENSRQEIKAQKEATSQIETTAEASATHQNVDGNVYDDVVTNVPTTFQESIGNQEQEQLELSTDQQQAHLQLAETSEQRLEEAAPEEQQQEQNHEHIRAKRSYGQLTGGTQKLDNKQAEERLQASLDKLTAGDGPNYKISKIHSATTQVVSGTLTKIDAEIIDENNQKERCQIEIWSQPWLKNGNEVTFDCPNKELLKVRHSRSVENAEKKTHKKHNHHNLDKAEHLFNKFQIKFNRRYHNTMERQMRMRIFKQNLKTIEELNRNEMGSAKYGITEFSDMTSTEYKLRTGLWQREADKPTKNEPAAIPNIELPKEFDWREKGVVSEVKNQGSCGSCWAFSVTGNIEGIHAVKTGKLEEYSEQELLDCDTTDSACNGGLPDNAYEAIQKIGGLELESEYPYEARKQQCHFNKTLVHVKISGAVDLPKNETAMAQWLIANGPISIGINANAMQFYRGGVSHPWHPLCSQKNLDHGVLIVGYGISDYPMFKKTLPYWIVKNSWGPKWGEQGYYRVYRGDNTCGVSEMATSAILAND